MGYLATGKPAIRIGHLLVVTDDHHRLLGVGVVGATNQTVGLTMVGERAPTMIIRATWTGVLPRVGDYLMSQYRPRCAFRIVRDPMEQNDLDVIPEEDHVTKIRLTVERRELPLPGEPAGAMVYPWKWDPRGKNAGNGPRRPRR